MSDDSMTEADLNIIRLYGLRFKIEHTFKQAVRVIGAFSYHFWMKNMKPLPRRSGDQYLHRESHIYREAVKRKINAYHVVVHVGIVSQGLLHYLAACFPELVWRSFGSWLRTIRPGIPPSELVVATALRHSLAKFIVERQDFDRLQVFWNSA
jgi:hypothetical protein